jgi:hypothetical protein
VRFECVHAALSIAPHTHQAGVAQNPEVLRDGWLRQRKALDKIAGSIFTLRKKLYDVAPRWVGKGRKSVHDRII